MWNVLTLLTSGNSYNVGYTVCRSKDCVVLFSCKVYYILKYFLRFLMILMDINFVKTLKNIYVYNKRLLIKIKKKK